MSTSVKAIRFAYNLRPLLNNEMGLKFCGESGFLPGFGNVTITAFNIS